MLHAGSPAPSDCQDGHEWVVFSTNISHGTLMVQCVNCGAFGTVDDQSKQEWSQAYHAPSRPYRWEDATRITPRGSWPIHVIRATEGPKCECYAVGRRLEPGEYERFPAEIMGPVSGLDEKARDEFIELAEMVGSSDLCGGLFAFFVRSFDEASGHRHSEALYEVIDRLDKMDLRGLHCSPGVVAKVLRDLTDGAVTPVAGLRKKHRPKDPLKAYRRRREAASRAASPRRGAR